MAKKTDERYDYAALTEMAKAFKAAAETLNQTIQAAKQISQMMESGALEGEAGDQFRAAINGDLTKKLTNLSAKMVEMQKDVEKAMKENKSAVAESKSRFN